MSNLLKTYTFAGRTNDWDAAEWNKNFFDIANYTNSRNGGYSPWAYAVVSDTIQSLCSSSSQSYALRCVHAGSDIFLVNGLGHIIAPQSPCFRAVASNSGGQAIADSDGITKIQFKTETFDYVAGATGLGFDSATNYNYTAPATGKYLVSALITVAFSSVTAFTVHLYLNNSAIRTYKYENNADASSLYRSVLISDVLQLTGGGGVLDIRVSCDTVGASITIPESSSAAYSYFCGAKVA